MKAHLEHSKVKYQPLCQKRFNSGMGVSASLYEIVSEEKLLELSEKRPDYCCKKCLAKINKA